PDIAAPRVNVLAAWSGADRPTKLSIDHRVVNWDFDSGATIACSRVAATAALLKAEIISKQRAKSSQRNRPGINLQMNHGNHPQHFSSLTGHSVRT
ncbi:hypothetical protein Ancab_005516, partial [Ancistrocladus abbreviatus]